MRYKRNDILKWYKDNTINVFTDYYIYLENVEEETKKKLLEKYKDYNTEEETLVLDYNTYDKNSLDFYNVEGIFIDTDDNFWEDNLNDILDTIHCREYKHYLILSNCNWLYKPMYKIVDNKTDILYRDYESHIVLKDISKGLKVVDYCEYSHDTPTGSNVKVIGLTDTEYENFNIDYFMKRYYKGA